MSLTLCLANSTLIVPALNRIKRRHRPHSFRACSCLYKPFFMWFKCTVHFIIISYPGSSIGSDIYLYTLSPSVQAKQSHIILEDLSEFSGLCYLLCVRDGGGRGSANKTKRRLPFAEDSLIHWDPLVENKGMFTLGGPLEYISALSSQSCDSNSQK